MKGWAVLLVAPALALGFGWRQKTAPAEPRSSYFLVVTGKSGLLSFAAGHKHAVLAEKWSAETRFDPQQPEQSRVEVRVPAASLVIDSSEGLRLAGLGRGPSADDVREIQQKMLGPKNLAVEQHPELHFRSETVRIQDADTLLVEGNIMIRGQTRRVTIPVDFRRVEEGYQFTGEAELKLRDFGIEPESVAGVVKVSNDFKLRFSFRAPAGEARATYP